MTLLPNDTTLNSLPLDLGLNSSLIFVGLPTHSKIPAHLSPTLSLSPPRACFVGRRTNDPEYPHKNRLFLSNFCLIYGRMLVLAVCNDHDLIRPSTLLVLHQLSVCRMFSTTGVAELFGHVR